MTEKRAKRTSRATQAAPAEVKLGVLPAEWFPDREAAQRFVRSESFRTLLEWCVETPDIVDEQRERLGDEAVRYARSAAYSLFLDLHALLAAVDGSEGPIRFGDGPHRMLPEDFLRGLDTIVRAELLEHTGHPEPMSRYGPLFGLMDRLRDVEPEPEPAAAPAERAEAA